MTKKKKEKEKEKRYSANGCKIEARTYKESDVPRVEQDPYTSCKHTQKKTRNQTQKASCNKGEKVIGIQKLTLRILRP